MGHRGLIKRQPSKAVRSYADFCLLTRASPRIKTIHMDHHWAADHLKHFILAVCIVFAGFYSWRESVLLTNEQCAE